MPPSKNNLALLNKEPLEEDMQQQSQGSESKETKKQKEEEDDDPTRQYLVNNSQHTNMPYAQHCFNNIQRNSNKCFQFLMSIKQTDFVQLIR
jgi:hypothetical protein